MITTPVSQLVQLQAAMLEAANIPFGHKERRDGINEPAVTMPKRVYEPLRGGFVDCKAEWLTRQLLDSPADERVTHSGNPFGRVSHGPGVTTPARP